MLVFYDARLVLLSVPKTGTSAYQEALQSRADLAITNPPELKHAPLYRYNRWIRPMFARVCNAELDVAAVMREPVSWLGSWYRFRQRPFLDGKTTSTRGLNFDDFVRDYCKGQQPEHAKVGSQAKFLEAQKNGCRVTHLFRYEDQPRLQQFLQDRLGGELALRQRNVSPAMDLTLSPEIDALYRRKKPDEFALYDSIT
ncbi:gamma-glutamyl kinase [Pseudophaeobacter flagellatus]|uniref:gamma-glutamyl kinase n=1 Tax=Pseudophaeobacter flagellatus TaxID=2899119 RepID=UPI001E6259BE|nr:gamma-glutamyl kinase [Pseudophaeobacter flagellatus]MCD9150023.1 gamma-glutamyl kinase [Pseudophaeobacter flagellatus]